MSWRGKDVLHKERFFLARTDRTEIDTSGLDEKERSWTLGHRWWTADEIAASSERFEPLDLRARSCRRCCATARRPSRWYLPQAVR